MTALSDVIRLQIILALMMGMGLLLTKKGVITTAGRRCLTDLLIDLILPCNIIHSFLGDMKPSVLLGAGQVLLLALAVQVVCWLGGKVLYRFAPRPRSRVLQYATMCSNAGFMGNPIIEGIYGAQGLLYACVYLIPLRFFMWSAGLACFTTVSWKETLKKLAVHPCIIAVWIGFFCLLTQCSLPAAVSQTITYLSNCTLAVSILIIGSILAGVEGKTLLTPTLFYFCGIRLLGIPLVTLAVCRVCGMDALATGVCVLLAGMPAGSTTAILAEKYGGDARYASQSVLVSTLLSLITIPLLCQLMAALP